jgi:hypothetical protein
LKSLLHVSAIMFVGLVTVAPAVHAGVLQSYTLTWSGASQQNGATATGHITLDLSTVINPGTTFQNGTPFVTAFDITVTGASSGNGTFGFADFNGAPQVGGFYIITGGTLDFLSELVGQATPGGPWGSTHDGGTGDFNVFNNGTDGSAPEGTFYFLLTTNDGLGDTMALTSFKPDASTPEPSSLILLPAIFIAGLVVARKRPLAARVSHS